MAKTFDEKYPLVVERGIDEPTYMALKQSLYAGAKDESIIMVLDYCKARGLDPLMKPVHIVPMSVKEGDKYVMRDVVMPGINTYRIQASRSKDLAGTSSPQFGPLITENVGTAKNFTYPEWCEITVTKLIADRLVDFTAREYYLENYATKKRGDDTPNAMWFKRPRGQLAKCAEAQALRKGWPEIGQQPTYEEMEGKHTQNIVKDITPSKKTNLIADAAATPKVDPAWVFDIENLIADCVEIAVLNDIYADAMETCKQAGDKDTAEHIRTLCTNQKEALNG
jgi:phage recombination protein Bet